MQDNCQFLPSLLRPSSRKLGPRWKSWKHVNCSLKGIEKILSRKKRQTQQLISPLIRQDDHQFYKENVLDRELGDDWQNVAHISLREQYIFVRGFAILGASLPWLTFYIHYISSWNMADWTTKNNIWGIFSSLDSAHECAKMCLVACVSEALVYIVFTTDLTERNLWFNILIWTFGLIYEFSGYWRINTWYLNERLGITARKIAQFKGDCGSQPYC